MAGTELDSRRVVAALSEIEILRSLPPEEIQALVSVVTRLEFPAGAAVLREIARIGVGIERVHNFQRLGIHEL